MTRPVKETKQMFVHRKVGMKAEHWELIEEDAKKKGWTVSRYVRNVVVTFAQGKYLETEKHERTLKELGELREKYDKLSKGCIEVKGKLVHALNILGPDPDIDDV